MVNGDQHIVQSALAGVLLALASGAPWLFLGTLLTVGIALTRGLLPAMLARRRWPPRARWTPTSCRKAPSASPKAGRNC